MNTNWPQMKNTITKSKDNGPKNPHRADTCTTSANKKLAEAAELIEDKSPYYRYTPANVLENNNFKLYWNCSIIIDKTIPANKPDITLMNKKEKTTYSIDIVVLNTHNLAKTITEKQSKYQEILCEETVES
jgi:hypothetical protein